MDEPIRRDWKGLEDAFAAAVDADFAGFIAPDQPHHAVQLGFARSRLAEGRDLVASFQQIEALRGRDLLCLDVGGGNGGVALGLANFRRIRVHTFDCAPNPTMARALRAAALPIRRTFADVSALPYARETFDVVVLMDVVEHVRDRRSMGAEIMRVLKPGGVCFVTTPARLRYFWRRDPHYGIRGLVALPNAVQRVVVNRLLRRRIHGGSGEGVPAYDVTHTFWSVGEIARLFPGRARVEPLYGFPLQTSAPLLSREGLRAALRDYVFHHVLIWKA